MINTDVRFRLSCDLCHQTLIYANSYLEATDCAHENGWLEIKSRRLPQHVTAFLCGACLTDIKITMDIFKFQVAIPAEVEDVK